MTRCVIPCLLLALAAGPAAADDGASRRYELPGFDALELTLPAGWQDSLEEQPGSAELTIELRPSPGTGFEAFITPEANGHGPGRILDAETLRESVRDAASRLTPGSVPVPLELRRLQGTDGVGYYFVATEQVPPPEGHPHLVQGALLVGGLVLRFEMLAEDGQDPAIAQGLAILQGAVHRDRGLGRP
jgi:hypothetical protein